MKYTTQNNFNKFKSDFKKDTGLDADKNIETYISYYNARVNDLAAQYITLLINKP